MIVKPSATRAYVAPTVIPENRNCRNSEAIADWKRGFPLLSYRAALTVAILSVLDSSGGALISRDGRRRNG